VEDAERRAAVRLAEFRRSKAASIVADAEGMLAAGDFARARARASEALVLVYDDPDARAVLARCDAQAVQREADLARAHRAAEDARRADEDRRRQAEDED